MLADRLQHTLRPSASPRSKPDESTWACRARPKGVLGAEVWLTLIDAGQLAPNDGGKTAVYMARPPRHGESSTRRICGPPRRIFDWGNTRGEKGPWPEIATATVAA